MVKRKKYNDLTLEQAQELFKYENGKLYWKSCYKFSHHSIGDKVGTTCYLTPKVKIKGKYYLLHRIVYLLHHGNCPKIVDFIDKTLTDGMYDISIENLYKPKRKVQRIPNKRFVKDISYHEANTYFEYRCGRLYWKEKPSVSVNVEVGQLAGGPAGGYLRIKLHKKIHMQHRIVYLLHHGYCPELVSFINKQPTHEGFFDISIENLREATQSQIANKSSNNRGRTSKYRGVHFDKRINKYIARLSIKGDRKRFGYFDNEEDAARKYDEMARQLVGEDAVLNFPE